MTTGCGDAGVEHRKVYDLPNVFVFHAILPSANTLGLHRISSHHKRSAVRYLVAEIPITRKERRNIWPALIGLLALVIVLGFLFGRKHVTRPGLAADTTSSTTSATSTGSVADTSRHP